MYKDMRKNLFSLRLFRHESGGWVCGGEYERVKIKTTSPNFW